MNLEIHVKNFFELPNAKSRNKNRSGGYTERNKNGGRRDTGLEQMIIYHTYIWSMFSNGKK